jgi:hypothetical protein
VDNLDARTEAILRSMVKPGDLFNGDVLDKFFEENKSALPRDASIRQNVELRKNVKDGTVSIRFDFFACPEGERPTPSDR